MSTNDICNIQIKFLSVKRTRTHIYDRFLIANTTIEMVSYSCEHKYGTDGSSELIPSDSKLFWDSILYLQDKSIVIDIINNKMPLLYDSSIPFYPKDCDTLKMYDTVLTRVYENRSFYESKPSIQICFLFEFPKFWATHSRKWGTDGNESLQICFSPRVADFIEEFFNIPDITPILARNITMDIFFWVPVPQIRNFMPHLESVSIKRATMWCMMALLDTFPRLRVINVHKLYFTYQIPQWSRQEYSYNLSNIYDTDKKLALGKMTNNVLTLQFTTLVDVLLQHKYILKLECPKTLSSNYPNDQIRFNYFIKEVNKILEARNLIYTFLEIDHTETSPYFLRNTLFDVNLVRLISKFIVRNPYHNTVREALLHFPFTVGVVHDD